MFSNQHRQEVKEANPQLTMVEIAKKLGEMWRGMESEVRTEWDAKATTAKDNYLVSRLQIDAPPNTIQRRQPHSRHACI